MSIDRFHQTAQGCGQLVTLAYSTSFSIGVRLLAPRCRPAIYTIYGNVRYADQIVDSFHNQDKATLLRRFRADTYLALEESISLNLIIHAFARAMHRYQVERLSGRISGFDGDGFGSSNVQARPVSNVCLWVSRSGWVNVLARVLRRQ